MHTSWAEKVATTESEVEPAAENSPAITETVLIVDGVITRSEEHTSELQSQ